ncbi:MAG: 2-keto-4-pentenoate hydratase [Streptosporangiales bacterium]|nr:2-keto-4-pentenoate hydratase [Streptosporangiales bacterium]
MSQQIEQLAAELDRARRDRVPVPPLTERFPELTVDDAYAVQSELLRLRLAEGHLVKGYKIGLTSAAMQRQLGVDQPDYAQLSSDMFLDQSTPVGGTLIQGRVEPEVAFVLGRTLTGPGVTTADVLSATDYVLPALEVIDSRIEDWRISLVDTIADHASSAGVVLGSRPTPLTAAGDLRLMGCNLYRNGELVGTGAGAATLGSPATSVAWLANKLGSLGVPLAAGMVVLPGSITAAVPSGPGDTVMAMFNQLGNVTCSHASAA